MKARDDDTEWARMLSHVGTGKFDVILARDLDRLLRTLQDLVKLIDLSAKVAAVDGEIDLTTADGEFRATMLAAVARFEIRRKSGRAIGANETRRRKGVQIIRGRILGYDEDGVTQIDDEAASVKKAFEDFLAGVKITHIARELTAQGFTTTRGRAWSNENIRSLLGNARYKGVLRGGRQTPKNVSSRRCRQTYIRAHSRRLCQPTCSKPFRQSSMPLNGGAPGALSRDTCFLGWRSVDDAETKRLRSTRATIAAPPIPLRLENIKSTSQSAFMHVSSIITSHATQSLLTLSSTPWFSGGLPERMPATSSLPPMNAVLTEMHCESRGSRCRIDSMGWPRVRRWGAR